MLLNDAFELWKSGFGIFHYLETLDVPWKNTVSPSSLDLIYHGNHSGKKLVSPIVEEFVVDGVVSTDNKNTLASMIFALNSVKWDKLYKTLSAEYNPIENYRMEEQEDNDGSGNSNLYGFNSTNATPTANNDAESHRTLTRSGNIGVTTSQQMLQSERDLWQWKFFEDVFKDIDDLLVLEVY